MPTRGLGDVDLEALLQKSIPSPNASTLVIVIFPNKYKVTKLPRNPLAFWQLGA